MSTSGEWREQGTGGGPWPGSTSGPSWEAVGPGSEPSPPGSKDWTNTGIVVGLVCVVVLAVGILYLLMTGDDDGDDEDVATNGQTDQPDGPQGDDQEPSVDPEALTISVRELEEGDCFNNSPGDGDGAVDRIAISDCRVSHDNEVYVVFDLEHPPEEPWRGNETVRGWVLDGCTERYEDFVGIAPDDSELDFGAFYPTIGSWEGGDRRVACYVYDPDATTTGSLAGAAR